MLIYKLLRLGVVHDLAPNTNKAAIARVTACEYGDLLYPAEELEPIDPEEPTTCLPCLEFQQERARHR